MELLAARFKDFSLYVFTKYFTTSCLGIIKTSFYVYKCITFPLNKPKIWSITADFYKEIISDYFSSLWLHMSSCIAAASSKPLKSFPYNLYLLMLIGIGFQDLKNLRRILLWRIGMSERQDFSFSFQLTASGVRWKLNDFYPVCWIIWNMTKTWYFHICQLGNSCIFEIFSTHMVFFHSKTISNTWYFHLCQLGNPCILKFLAHRWCFFTVKLYQMLKYTYGPSMMSQRKTPWKDPQGGFRGVWGVFSGERCLERPFRPL